jgi:hypothetical protein
MEQTTSRVPALLEALTARFTTALPTWQVLDGPPFSQVVEQLVLIVGHADYDGTAVTEAVARTQGMGHRYTETFQVRCILSAETGDEDVKGPRDTCHAALAAIEAALQSDRGVGGVVDLANLGPARQWAQAQTEQGATAEVAFTVEARVTR